MLVESAPVCWSSM